MACDLSTELQTWVAEPVFVMSIPAATTRGAEERAESLTESTLSGEQKGKKMY